MSARNTVIRFTLELRTSLLICRMTKNRSKERGKTEYYVKNVNTPSRTDMVKNPRCVFH